MLIALKNSQNPAIAADPNPSPLPPFYFLRPLVSFRGNKNLHKSLTKSHERFQKCPSKNSKTSLYFLYSPKLLIFDYLNCTTSNLLFCNNHLFCKHYTSKKLGDRFGVHFRDVQSNDLALTKQLSVISKFWDNLFQACSGV